MNNWIKNILIYVVGTAIVCLLVTFNGSKSEFIEENGIVTWTAIHVCIVYLICYGLTTKKPFWKSIMEDEIMRCENTVQNCENRIENLETANEKIIDIFIKEFEKSQEIQNDLKLEIKNLEKALKNLSSQVLDHTEDCYDLYHCDECGKLNEGERLVLDGNDICDYCSMATYFKKAKTQRHNPNPLCK